MALNFVTKDLLLVLVILLGISNISVAAENTENIKEHKPQRFLVYKSYQDQDGTPTFSDKQPLHAHYTILDYSCFACNVHSTVNWYTVALNTSSYANQIQKRNVNSGWKK